MLRRPRRNRQSQTIRDMVQETQVPLSALVNPLFILPGENRQEEIASMPGILRHSIDHMLREMEACMKLGLKSFILFPAVPDDWKDKTATYSYDPENFYLKAIQQAKEEFPECAIITDVAMDPYSSDGHDGLVENGQILSRRRPASSYHSAFKGLHVVNNRGERCCADPFVGQ